MASMDKGNISYVHLPREERATRDATFGPVSLLVNSLYYIMPCLCISAVSEVITVNVKFR
jgi:hypothetical protein